MRAFKAAVQALVSHAVAVAVARLLVDDTGDLGSQFIGVRLEWILFVVRAVLCLELVADRRLLPAEPR